MRIAYCPADKLIAVFSDKEDKIDNFEFVSSHIDNFFQTQNNLFGNILCFYFNCDISIVAGIARLFENRIIAIATEKNGILALDFQKPLSIGESEKVSDIISRHQKKYVNF